MAVLQYKPRTIQPNKSKLKPREYLKWNTISVAKWLISPNVRNVHKMCTKSCLRSIEYKVSAHFGNT